jgi:DNA (cytosine-5)-methyltransferase 1
VTKLRLLDLCCGAGGATRGFQRAGFDVVGVDIKLQPNYVGDDFCQADALGVLRALVFGKAWQGYVLADFDAIHASFPCQSKTAYRRKGYGVGDGYPNLIPEGRALLEQTGLPYVIENVEGFRSEMHDPITLCGSSFGLDVRRHRLFETNWPLEGKPCDHASQTLGRFPGATNRKPMSRATVEVGVWRIPLEVQQRAMGIDWMELDELSESIPPAYTHYVGQQLRIVVRLSAKV